MTDNSVVECLEDCLHNIADIDECYVLTLEPNGKVAVVLYALHHNVIVLFTWSIDAGGTENNVREA